MKEEKRTMDLTLFLPTRQTPQGSVSRWVKIWDSYRAHVSNDHLNLLVGLSKVNNKFLKSRYSS